MKGVFKKTSKKHFEQLLRKRKLEDFKTIQNIESILKQKRGYVFKMPPPNSPVILLVSGGMDSTIVWNILMEEYKLKVYPVHLFTGQPRNQYETEALKHYARFFKKRHPEYYQDPHFITYNTTPPEIRRATRGNLIKHLHPQVVTDNFDVKKNEVLIKKKYTFPAFMPFPACQVAQFYEINKNEKIRTIILSTVSSDAEYNESQSLTATRATMLALCAYTNEYDWQVINYPYEKELGHNLNKKDLISWAHKHNLPLDKTYSCHRGQKNNCGECLVCNDRIKGFKQAKVSDATFYHFPSQQKTYIKTFKVFLKNSSAYPLIKHLKKQVRKNYSNKKLNRYIKPKVKIKDYF